MRRTLVWLLALAVWAGVMAAAPIGAAGSVEAGLAPWCGDGPLRVDNLPARVSPADCDMVGRRVVGDGVHAVVPPAGEGRIVAAVGAREASLQLTTLLDGTVQISTVEARSATAMGHQLAPAAAGVTNDNMADARPVTLGQELPNQTTIGGTREPVDDRADYLCGDYKQTLQETVWYRLRIDSSRDVIVELLDQVHYGQPSLTYLIAEVFVRDAEGRLQPSECFSDHFEAAKDRTYFIRVGSYYGQSTFTFLARAATAADRPDNDQFAQARVMWLPSGSTVERLRLATLQAGEPRPTCGPTVDNTVWYRLRPGTLRRVRVQSDAAVALYRGSSVSSLRRVACLTSTEFHPTVLVLPQTGPYYVQAWRAPRFQSALVRFASGEPCVTCAAPCEVDNHAFYDGRPRRRTYAWRFNGSGVPEPLSRSGALSAIKSGIAVITHSKNDCGLADHVDVQSVHQGSTSRGASMCASRPDGVNVVTFGHTPSDFLGVTCSRTRLRDGRWRIVESDMVLNRKAAWTLSPDARSCQTRYDLLGTVAHETGHVFGLNHVRGDATRNLTMSPSSPYCTGAIRTLGRGDVLGLRTLY